jgi:hypothetical protein
MSVELKATVTGIPPQFPKETATNQLADSDTSETQGHPNRSLAVQTPRQPSSQGFKSRMLLFGSCTGNVNASRCHLHAPMYVIDVIDLVGCCSPGTGPFRS